MPFGLNDRIRERYPEPTDSNEKRLAAMVRDGRTLRGIGALLNVTGQAVSDWLYANGLHEQFLTISQEERRLRPTKHKKPRKSIKIQGIECRGGKPISEMIADAIETARENQGNATRATLQAFADAYHLNILTVIKYMKYSGYEFVSDAEGERYIEKASEA